MSTKLRLEHLSYEATTEEEWQRRHRQEHELDQLGFAEDDEVVALGLDDMEDELTMEMAQAQHLKAPFVNVDRRKANPMPVSEATPDEARAARIGEHPGDLGLTEDEVD
jgi:hypothetical protein